MLVSKLRSAFAFASACLLSAMLAGAARGGAPEFPPGSFSDGGHYKLSDFDGKVLVLFFYEQNCPRCRGLIPERNKVVDQFKNKPVKFIAVAPGDTLNDALAYTRETKLKMPAFSDIFGVMQTRYGFQISMQNIYQFRIIGPKGDIVGMSMEPAEIEKAVASVSWKYKDAGYHASLSGIIDMLEWNQYEPALRQLKPLVKAGNKAVAESATKLLEAVKTEGAAWLEEAGKFAEIEPVKAFDLYRKASNAFAGDDLGKQADVALKGLSKNKAVLDELAARDMFDQMSRISARATMNQKPAFINQALAIAKKYPDAPTGKKAGELADDLQKATAE